MQCVKIRKKYERNYKLNFIISTFGWENMNKKFDIQNIFC